MTEEISFSDLRSMTAYVEPWADACKLVIDAVTGRAGPRRLVLGEREFDSLRGRASSRTGVATADFSALLVRCVEAAVAKKEGEYVLIATTGSSDFWGHVFLHAWPQARRIVAAASPLPGYTIVAGLNRMAAHRAFRWLEPCIRQYVALVTWWRETRLRLRGYRVHASSEVRI